MDGCMYVCIFFGWLGYRCCFNPSYSFISFSFAYTCSSFLSLLEYCFFGLPRDQRVFYLDLFIEILNIIFCVQYSLYKIEGIQYGILYFPTHVICIFSLLARWIGATNITTKLDIPHWFRRVRLLWELYCKY